MLPLAFFTVMYTHAEQDTVERESRACALALHGCKGLPIHPEQRMRTPPPHFAFHMAQPVQSALLLPPEPSALCQNTAGLTPLSSLQNPRCRIKDAILRINTNVY